ncbi:uncharacterized protein LOC129586103 [Paramacrobiotus metropolitanus]|uniref:uncharacterized protein LOC129586103 n=1 Tax=Paramacrobiotus metropolitanus TaxID=2943436 RepID=UPI0024464080|nr:uncharacterized protein LOC129586103 [Paramacrobiotus metropolitanus]
MFRVFLLCMTGSLWLSTVNADDIKYTIPANQSPGFTPYVRIEQPWPNGGSNHKPSGWLYRTSKGSPSIYDDTLLPGQKRCPVDGDPHCHDCVAGYKTSDFVQSQCCFAHHWAWMNKRTIRDVLPYRFHLSPVNQTEPYADRYATAGEIWQEDPCTKEPKATIPDGPYIPCRQRNACPDVRKDGTIW